VKGSSAGTCACAAAAQHLDFTFRGCAPAEPSSFYPGLGPGTDNSGGVKGKG